METVYKNEELLKLVYGSYLVLDAEVIRFEIYEQDYVLCVDVCFKSLDRKLKKEQLLKIHFVNVVEYDFYFHKSYNFYDVASYKFFKTEKGYYLSLDPYEGTEEPSEEDQDFILAESVDGWFI